MPRKKKTKERGKMPLSRYFQKLKEGDSVAVIHEKAVQSVFPEKLQGRTGKVESKRGKSYVVKINDSNKEKKYIIEPIHLKKIKDSP